MEVIIQDFSAPEDQWTLDLQILPLVGHLLIIHSDPKAYLEVTDVSHHIGADAQRIVLAVKRVGAPS